MPFTVKKNHPSCPEKKPFAVVKTSDGKVMRCHATAKKAGAQIGAIEHSEEKEMTELKQTDFLEAVEEDEEKELMVVDHWGTVEDTDEFVPYNATSFNEYDVAVDNKKAATEFKKTANVFRRLVDNVLSDFDSDNAVEGIRSLATEFGERIKGILPRKEKKMNMPFNVFYSKERKQYLWFSSYSNNYLDQDNPPEIIAEKSHIRFEKMVDAGKAPLPELCLWHVRSHKLGEAEVVTYDKETGVAMAAGFFYKEAEPIAKIIADNPEQWGVSHGMSGEHVKKEENVIVEHITDEISPLPQSAAANMWAAFSVIKEISMSISKTKREALNKMGVDDNMLADVEDTNKSLADEISTMGVPTKEVAGDEVPTEESPVEELVSLEEQIETPEAEPVEEAPPEESSEELAEEVSEEAPAEEAPAEEALVEEAPAEEPAEAPEGEVFSEEQTKQLMDAFNTFGKKMTEAILSEVKEAVAPIVQSTEEKAVELIETASPVTLQELILSSPLLKKQSATFSLENVLDGRSTLAKDKPEETVPQHKSVVNSGNGLVDAVVTNVVHGTLQ